MNELPADERCRLIAAITSYMVSFSDQNVVSHAVWYDMGWLLFPAIARGRKVYFRPKVKTVWILKKNPALWERVQPFIVLHEGAEWFYERRRINERPFPNSADAEMYLKRLGITQ